MNIKALAETLKKPSAAGRLDILLQVAAKGAWHATKGNQLSRKIKKPGVKMDEQQPTLKNNKCGSASLKVRWEFKSNAYFKRLAGPPHLSFLKPLGAIEDRVAAQIVYY